MMMDRAEQYSGKGLSDSEERIIERIESADPVLSDEVLLNGARFLSAEVKGNPEASVAIHFDAGSKREQEGEHGSLHFFEHLPPSSFRMLSGGEDLISFTQGRNWKIDIHINKEVLTFGFQVPDFDTAEALCVLGDIMGKGEQHFAEVFDIEKGRILEEIERALVSPSSIKYDAVSEMIHYGTGRAHPVAGTKEAVAQYSFDDVMKMGRRYLFAENATFAVSGGAEQIQQAREFFEKVSLPGIGSDRAVGLIAPTRQLQDLDRESVHISPHFPGVEIVALLPGLPVGDEREHTALFCVVDALGKYLNGELSHKQGLTYGAGAGQLAVAESGVVQAGMSVAPANFSDAQEAFMKVLRDFPGTIMADVLEAYYRSNRNQMYLSAGRDNYAGDLEIHAMFPHLKMSTSSDDLRKIASLTVEEVRSLAEHHIDPAQVRFLYFGSEESVQEAGIEK